MVLDYFFFQLAPGDPTSPTAHQILAGAGMSAFDAQNEAHFDRLRRQLLEEPAQLAGLRLEDLEPARRFTLRYDLAGASCSPVTLDEFLAAYRPAFLDPPYRLRLDAARAAKLCEESLTVLLGDLAEWSICAWSDDWSNYFDAGKEWWGAYLWTLCRADGRGVWIGASTTD